MAGDESLVLDSVECRAGRALVFYHRLMHEGLPSLDKHIIRTDLIYRRKEPLLTSECDTEAFRLYQEAELKAENGEHRAACDLFSTAFKMSEQLRKIYKQ